MIQDAGDFTCSTTGDEIASAIVPLIAALLGTPETTATVTDLWQFIFLSHPAACTYINYRIRGHCEWMLIGEWAVGRREREERERATVR